MPEPTCWSCGFVIATAHAFCPSCGARARKAEGAGPEDVVEERSRERLQAAVGSAYRVGQLLGRGGFAEVFEADDVRLGRKVAIKVIRPDLAVSEQLLERFQREARAIATLRHPNVMDVYTVGEENGVAYFVMPLVVGESLKGRIGRVGPLPLDDARRILVDTASALAAAHRAGTIHRDVKPDNILIESESGRVLIADFGIAKALVEETTGLTASGIFVGTPRYMSPEQATGDALDHRSDIYSLGVVAFEMISGRPPFEARSAQAMVAKHLTERPPRLETLRTECPSLVSQVVERCLAKDPAERWESLQAMIEVLEGRRELPPEGVRAHASGPPAMGIEGRDSAGGASGPLARDVALRGFRRAALAVAVALMILVGVDAFVGVGGLSAVAALAGLAYLAAWAGRLWSTGYEWRDMLRGSGGDPPGDPDRVEAARADADQDGFGRLGSLVRACVADRAAILSAFAQLTRQEQARFPRLRETVEELAGHVKHQVRRVLTLEARLAEAARRSERSVSHHTAVRELGAARDAAASEMRACVQRLEEVRQVLTERATLDLDRASGELEAALARAGACLGRRGV